MPIHVIEFSTQLQITKTSSVFLPKRDSTTDALPAILKVLRNIYRGTSFQDSYRWQIWQLELLKRNSTKYIFLGRATFWKISIHVIEFFTEMQTVKAFFVNLPKCDSTEDALPATLKVLRKHLQRASFQYSYRWFIGQFQFLKRKVDVE